MYETQATIPTLHHTRPQDRKIKTNKSLSGISLRDSAPHLLVPHNPLYQPYSGHILGIPFYGPMVWDRCRVKPITHDWARVDPGRGFPGDSTAIKSDPLPTNLSLFHDFVHPALVCSPNKPVYHLLNLGLICPLHSDVFTTDKQKQKTREITFILNSTILTA